jgi:hypothetical protein
MATGFVKHAPMAGSAVGSSSGISLSIGSAVTGSDRGMLHRRRHAPSFPPVSRLSSPDTPVRRPTGRTRRPGSADTTEPGLTTLSPSAAQPGPDGAGDATRPSDDRGELGQMLAECGTVVDHVAVCQWVRRFTPLLIDGARSCRGTSVRGGQESRSWTRDHGGDTVG